MNALRRLVFGHRRLAVCMMAAALCVKLLVPGGYMPVVSDGRIMVSICSGMASGAQTTMMTMHGMAAGADHDDAGSSDHQKAQMPCAFAGLGLASLAATDPVLIASAIAFVMALGVAAVAPVSLTAPAFLRPQLRGPPAIA